MAQVKHSIVYQLKGDEKDLIQDLKKVGKEFDRLQSNFKEGLTARSAVRGAAGAAAGAGGLGAAGVAGVATTASAAGTATQAIKATGEAAATTAVKTGLLAKAMTGIKAVAPTLGLIGAGATVIRFGKSVVDNTRQLELWQAQYESLGMGAKVAAQEVRKTIDFASATVLGTEEIIKARAQLTFLGLDTREVLRTIADAAQASGVSINTLAEGLGRVQAGDIGGLRVLKKFGVTPESLEARAAALGGGPQANVQAALEKLVEKFGGTTDRMESTIESMKGTLANEWTKATAEIGKNLEPAIKGLLDAATDLAKAAGRSALGFRAATEARQEWFKVITDYFESEQTPIGFMSTKGMGARARELLAGAPGRTRSKGIQGYDQHGFPIIPGQNAQLYQPPTAPTVGTTEWIRQRNAAAYAAVTRSQVINNVTNFTQYSPVGIAPQSNLAGLAP